MKRERTFDYSRKEEIAGTTEWSSKMIREEKQVKDVCHNSDMIESNILCILLVIKSIHLL